MAAPRRRKPKRRVWGWLPTKSEATRFGLLLAAVGAWLDARCNPDPRTAAVTSLAVTGVETDAAVADSIAELRRADRRLNRRLGRVERALHLSSDKASERDHASPAPAKQETGWRGFLSRWLGHSDRR